jgi:hypothetical protein
MSGETARLKLAELPEGQAMNAAEINTVLGQLDALVDCCLKGVFVDAPPVSAADGDIYLVGGSPTGDWGAEFTYKLAYRRDGAWEPVIPFDGMRAFVPATNAFLVYADGAWTDWNSLISAAETAIASAATCDIGAAGSLFVAVTGTSAITSFGTAANKLRFLRFAGALTLTHDATALVLPGGASIVTAAGDTALLASDGSGNWRCRFYQRASRGDAADDLLAAGPAGSALTAAGLGIGKIPTEMLDIKSDQDAPTAVVIDNQYNSENACSRISMRAWGYTWFIQVGSTSANANHLDFLGDAGNVRCMRINFHGVEVGDFTNTTENNCHFQIRGNGYAGEHWLDGDAYYIGQNSAVRELRMFSGASPTIGVKLTAGATSWATICDMTTKVRIEGIDDALRKAAAIEGFIGRYADDGAETRRAFINGQQLRAVLPEATALDAEGRIVARLTEMIPLHAAAFAEVARHLAGLQAALAAQAERIAALEVAHAAG